ncbi:CPC_1213 family protein [Clostridium senegalense]|nr:CPC_1213 family protein [Clostridium senegalense]
MGNKMKKKKNNGHKHVDHDPRTESAKAVFGEPKAKEYNPTDFKI